MTPTAAAAAARFFLFRECYSSQCLVALQLADYLCLTLVCHGWSWCKIPRNVGQQPSPIVAYRDVSEKVGALVFTMEVARFSLLAAPPRPASRILRSPCHGSSLSTDAAHLFAYGNVRINEHAARVVHVLRYVFVVVRNSSDGTTPSLLDASVFIPHLHASLSLTLSALLSPRLCASCAACI